MISKGKETRHVSLDSLVTLDIFAVRGCNVVHRRLIDLTHLVKLLDVAVEIPKIVQRHCRSNS